MKITITIFLLLFSYCELIAQKIEFRKKNGVIISKPLTDEEWEHVKQTYVPDSLKYFPLTIVEYSPEEFRKMDEEAYRKALIANGVDSIEAYSIKYVDTTNKVYKKSTNEWSTKTIERIKKEYKGKIRIKKTLEVDSTDRYLLRVGFYNTAYSETGGWMSFNRFYFEDRKRKIIFPLIMREPKRLFEKI